MSSPLAYVLAGAILLVAGSLGLAYAARILHREDAGSGRFLATCLSCVALVWAFAAAVFCIGKPVVELPGAWGLIAGLVAVFGVVAIPMSIFRAFGPRTRPTAVADSATVAASAVTGPAVAAPSPAFGLPRFGSFEE